METPEFFQVTPELFYLIGPAIFRGQLPPRSACRGRTFGFPMHTVVCMSENRKWKRGETIWMVGAITDRMIRDLKEAMRLEKIPGQPLSHPGELGAATPYDGTGGRETTAQEAKHSAAAPTADNAPQGERLNGGTRGVKIVAVKPDKGPVS